MSKALFDAIAANDVSAFKKILESSPIIDFNYKDPEAGDTVLTLALKKQNKEIIEILSVKVFEHENTAIATSLLKDKSFQELLKTNEKLLFDCFTSSFRADRKGTANELLSIGRESFARYDLGNLFSIFIKNKAAYASDIAILRKLIYMGAKLDWKDDAGNTPLTAALISKEPLLLDTILEFYSFETETIESINQVIELPNKIDNIGKASYLTPLGHAIVTDNPALVDKLIEKKADLNKIDAAGQNALNYALFIGKYDAALAILKHFPKEERIRMLQEKDGFGMRPIDWIFGGLTEDFTLLKISDVYENVKFKCLLFISNFLNDFSEEEKLNFISSFKMGSLSILDFADYFDILKKFESLKPESKLKLLFDKNEKGTALIDKLLDSLGSALPTKGYEKNAFIEVINLIKESPEGFKKLYIEKFLDPKLLSIIFDKTEGDEKYISDLLQALPDQKTRIDVFTSFHDTSKSILMLLMDKVLNNSKYAKTLKEVLKLLDYGNESLIKSIDEFISALSGGRRGGRIFAWERMFSEFKETFPELSLVDAAKSLLKLKKRTDDYENEFNRLQGSESSMDEAITVSANKHFDEVVKHHLKSQFEEYGETDAERLTNIETEIRKTILNSIVANYKSELEILKRTDKKEEVKLKPEDLKRKADDIKRIEEILTFIETNKDKIIALDKEVTEQVHQYFNSNTDFAQISWRAYDRSFPTTNWPNLLTEPDAVASESPVFSTAASSGGRALNRKMASDIVRERAAYYFLSAIDKNLPEGREDRILDFVQYIARIRRAHNEDRGDLMGQDNPSCFPGHITRLSLIGYKHPKIAMPSRKSVRATINEKVQAIIARKFSEHLKTLSKEDREKLLNALTKFNVDNAEYIVQHPISEYYNLDLFEIREKFHLDFEIGELTDEICEYVKEKLGIELTSKDLTYYRDFAFMNMGGANAAQQLYDIYRSQMEISAETPELEDKRQAEREAEQELKYETENPFTIGTMKYFVYGEIFQVLDGSLKFKEKVPNITEELVLAFFETKSESDVKSRLEETLKAMQVNAEINPYIEEIASIKDALIKALENANEKMKPVSAVVTKGGEGKDLKEEKIEKEGKVGERNEREIKERESKEREIEVQPKVDAKEEPIRDVNTLREVLAAKRKEYNSRIEGLEHKWMKEKGIVGKFDVLKDLDQKRLIENYIRGGDEGPSKTSGGFFYTNRR